MKKLYKIVAATILVVSTPYAASAGDGDDLAPANNLATADITNGTADVTKFETLAITEMNVDFGLSSADQNVAMVAQTGDTNIGYVNQSGVANFAAVVQDSTGAGSSAAAYVIQTGDTNRAVIIQQPS